MVVSAEEGERWRESVILCWEEEEEEEEEVEIVFLQLRWNHLEACVRLCFLLCSWNIWTQQNTTQKAKLCNISGKLLLLNPPSLKRYHSFNLSPQLSHLSLLIYFFHFLYNHSNKFNISLVHGTIIKYTVEFVLNWTKS